VSAQRTVLVLIRHGETDWNVEGRHQGQLDVPLNARGLAQSRAVAERLRGCGASVILSSDLLRALQTARAVAEAVGLPVAGSALLRERAFGRWQSLTSREIDERYPGDRAAYYADRWLYRPPGGESHEELWERSRRAAEWCLGKAASKLALVVTHGGPINCILGQSLGHPGGFEPAVKVSNCSLSVVAYAGARASIWKANDSAHAADASREEYDWDAR